MAFDMMKGECCGGDYSCGIGEDPDTTMPTIVTASDANRIVNKAIEEEQLAVEEVSKARGQGKIDDPTWRSFQLFHDQFHKWLASTGSRPYWALKFGLAGIYETAFDYRKKIKDWRDLAASKGAQAIGPKSRGVDEPKKDEGGSMWKWVAALAGGGLATMFILRKTGG